MRCTGLLDARTAPITVPLTPCPVDYEGSRYYNYWDTSAPWGKLAYIKFTITIQVGAAGVSACVAPWLLGPGDMRASTYLVSWIGHVCV